MDPCHFFEEVLVGNDISTFFGTPDSCLKGLLSYLSTAEATLNRHFVMASEGAAIASATGYYLSTGKLALVYMQNSGYGNALNPLQSLAAKEVFGIPMVILLGWRGRPGEKDEPEHALSGSSMLQNLQANDFPFAHLPPTIGEAKDTLSNLIIKAKQDNTPVALLVPNHAFSEPERKLPVSLGQSTQATGYKTSDMIPSLSAGPEPCLSRETAIRNVLRHMGSNDISISSVGHVSREIYMICNENGKDLSRHFLSIGAMGHAYPIAFGVTRGYGCDDDRVYCIEGDGSFIMHVGNTAVLAAKAPAHLVHVVIYNGIHGSTGGQPLPVSKSDFLSLVSGLPYRQKYFVNNEEALQKALQSASENAVIVVVVNDQVRKVLPRPSETAFELRDKFMTFISRRKNRSL